MRIPIYLQASVGALALAGFSAPAWAQDGDIIVTARKRDETILQAPVIVSALPQDRLERFGTSDLYDIANQVTGFQIATGTGSYGVQVSIRGVGTSTQNSAIDQSATLTIDGIQMSQGLAYKMGMFDLAQAEILKGPQALFYGKASTAGVIALRTADPGDELEIVSRTGYEFEAHEIKQDLILSGPVSNTLGLRLAGSYADSDGYFRNVGIATPGFGGLNPKYRNYSSSKNLLVRGTALWKPTDTFSARLKLNFSRDRVNGDGGGVDQFTGCPEGTASLSGIPFLGNGEDCKLDRYAHVTDLDPKAFIGVRNGGVPFQRLNQHFGSLELNWNVIDQLALTSVTGYYDVDQSTLLNGMVATTTTLAPDSRFHRDDFTQELRLASSFPGSALNFILGGYYQSGNLDNYINLLGNTALQLPPVLQAGNHHLDIESISAFGQLLWRPVPQIELAGGGRWTHETRRDRQTDLITGAPVITPLAVGKLASSHFSPEATITYKPNEDLTLFASYKLAYKSGSYDVTLIFAPGANNSFGDEKVQGFEGGIKTRLMDRQLTLDLAGYRYLYSNLQVGAAENSAGVLAIRTLNAASALVYGVDFDAALRPRAIDGLTLRAGANWNHARYRRFTNAPCFGGQTIGEGCNQVFNPATGLFTGQNLSGGRLVRSPDWSANFGFDYELPVGKGMRLTLSSTNLYSSKFYTNLILNGDSLQKGFVRSNASIALKDERDAWELALIGDNLSNKLTLENCVTFNATNGIFFGGDVTGGPVTGPAGHDESLCSAQRGRSVWLRLTLKPAALFRRSAH